MTTHDILIGIPLVISFLSLSLMWILPKKWITTSSSDNLDRILAGTPVRWVWLNKKGKALYLISYLSLFTFLGLLLFKEFGW